MEMIIKLTDAQVKALKTLGLSDAAQEIAEKAIASAIKGKYKYHADKAEGETAKSYEWAIRSGGKFDKDKGTFITTYMLEIRDTLNNL
jgi:hypothetical protein